MEDDALRRIERAEERLNQAERDVAALTSKLTSTKDDLSRRLDEVNRNLRDDLLKTDADMRERILALKEDVRDDISSVDSDVTALCLKVADATESLQHLYISQKGSNVTVKTNEKIVWTIIGCIGLIGSYLLQSYLKNTGG